MQRKFISLFVLLTFIANTLLSYTVSAQILPQSTGGSRTAPMLNLLSVSKPYSFPVLRGLKLDSKDPLNIKFIIDPGTQKEVNKEEAGLLIRYFLAALTIPRKPMG